MAIVALASAGGSTGEAMFACKLQNIVSAALEKHVEEAILERKKAWQPFNQECFVQWRTQLVESARTVEGLDQICSKRQVRIHYRGGFIGGVPVQSLVGEVETRIWATIKSIAVNNGLVLPMNAEELMNFGTNETDKDLKINPDFLMKAGLILCLAVFRICFICFAILRITK